MSQSLYIIHGWAYSIKPWTETVERLQRSGVNVHQLRVPGLTAPSDKTWTIDDYVKWLDDELTGVKKPIVLGHSNGGRIAMHYLATHPDRFSHLILLSSAGIEINPSHLSRKRRLFHSISKQLAILRRIPYVKKIVYRLLGSDYGAAPPNMQRTLTNMLASDHDFDPSLVKADTSILWGEDDQTTPPEMADKLHKLLPNSTLKLIPEWRHAPYRTHPSQLADEIIQIIGAQR